MVRAISQLALRRARGESGQSTVEFGLVVPLLCFLDLALVDFGLGMNDAIDATHLANEGARLAVVDEAVPAGFPSLQAYIKSLASTQDVKDATVTICAQNGAASLAGDWVKVKVSTSFNVVPFIDTSFPINGTATMRLEQKPTNFTPSAAGACS
jgi:Flp pilus assembly protein TadG